MQSMQVCFNDDNLSDIQAEYEGPAGTPYHDGIFKMRLVLGAEFPTAPPKGDDCLPLPLPSCHPQDTHPSRGVTCYPCLTHPLDARHPLPSGPFSQTLIPPAGLTLVA